jgi:SPP1 family predicted phage head-tail adaptor
MISAGELRDRIAIKARPSDDDAIGQPDGDNTTVVTLWAKRQPNRSREVFASGRDLDEQTETFTIRYRTDITAAHLVEWNGSAYEIQNVLTVGNKEELDLICRKSS